LDEIGLGLIGYSLIAKTHSLAWINFRQFFSSKYRPRLVGVCGRNTRATGEFARLNGYKRNYRDWRDLIRDPDVTVLDNCAPPNVHSEPSIEAAEAGKAVICEKPLGRSAEEAYEMYRAVAKTSQVHMTGFNRRFIPALLLARDLKQAGRLGRINHIVATMYNIEFGEGFGRPSIPLIWPFRREVAGHGAIGDVGAHIIDLIRFTVGEITSVSAAADTVVKERPLPDDPSRSGKVDVDDTVAGCLRLSEGAIGTISVSWLPVGIKDYMTLEVYGSRGSFKFSMERPNELELFLHDEDMRTEGFRTVLCDSRVHPLAGNFWPDQAGSYGYEQTFISEIAHFASALERGVQIESPGATFYDGYMACLIADELVASANDGKWHPVQPAPKL